MPARRILLTRTKPPCPRSSCSPKSRRPTTSSVDSSRSSTRRRHMRATEPQQISYPPVSLIVDEAQVTEFAEAVGADPTLGVPPTFAAVYALQVTIPQMLADDRVGIDAARMLHGEQEFEWFNHPAIGEELTAIGCIVHDNVKGHLRLVTLETLVTGTGGRPVCTARSVMVVR
ncbi:hypothetical protein EEB14_45805 [Rhodococcus sp. WS4]|nr:hypothetical protein EEB14_45805 [Rhodococcus sp. WS4]